jgi:hypothetical protein|tara:strand:+ start:291 stop:503 length:213 start_codon:yes stop_codon:yes gene_type:complete
MSFVPEPGDPGKSLSHPVKQTWWLFAGIQAAETNGYHCDCLMSAQGQVTSNEAMLYAVNLVARFGVRSRV